MQLRILPNKSNCDFIKKPILCQGQGLPVFPDLLSFFKEGRRNGKFIKLEGFGEKLNYLLLVKEKWNVVS